MTGNQINKRRTRHHGACPRGVMTAFKCSIFSHGSTGMNPVVTLLSQSAIWLSITAPPAQGRWWQKQTKPFFYHRAQRTGFSLSKGRL
ncbi:hypothetical protein ACFL27_15515 [candidate division CSSED10-310 bacterium]|uniref:Uncharacterized protein n=1 Tax=candidate division CSSED10-310 bacterium TaxID=2855610 RepID=A0ABV6YZH6_UNCC1